MWKKTNYFKRLFNPVCDEMELHKRQKKRDDVRLEHLPTVYEGPVCGVHKKWDAYNFKNDFNSDGEFHGVVLGVWQEQKKLEPTFGTFVNRA